MVLNEPENTPLPGTVFTPRQLRVLKVAVIVMGILLVGGFAFVLAAIVYQASKGGQESKPSPIMSGIATNLPVAKDATINSLSLDGNRLALHLNTGSGPEVVVVDLQTGNVLARIKLKPE